MAISPDQLQAEYAMLAELADHCAKLYERCDELEKRVKTLEEKVGI